MRFFSDRWLQLLSDSYRGHTYRCQIWGWLGDVFSNGRLLLPSVSYRCQIWGQVGALFDSCCDDGVNAAYKGSYRQVPNLGPS